MPPPWASWRALVRQELPRPVSLVRAAARVRAGAAGLAGAGSGHGTPGLDRRAAEGAGRRGALDGHGEVGVDRAAREVGDRQGVPAAGGGDRLDQGTERPAAVVVLPDRAARREQGGLEVGALGGDGDLQALAAGGEHLGGERVDVAAAVELGGGVDREGGAEREDLGTRPGAVARNGYREAEGSGEEQSLCVHATSPWWFIYPIGIDGTWRALH